MRALKNSLFVGVLLILFASTNFLFAQFEDEFEESTPQEEVQCMPKNMSTKWDTLYGGPLNEDIRLLYNFGYEYYKNKSYKDALPYLWKVFLHDSAKYAKASIRKIAEIYFNRGQVDSTLIACYRGLKLFPDMLRLNHYAGLLQNKLGKYKCAIPHFEILVAKDSTQVTYLKTLAFLYFRTEDERAIKYQEKVVALQPDNAEEANTLATYIKHFRGEGEDYLKYAEETWKKNPENVDYAYNYAEAASSAGEYKRALEPINTVIAKKPSKKAYLLRAEIYENLNQNLKAIADYKEMLKISPNDPNIMLRISVNYRNNHAFSKARYWINKALKAKPGYGEAYITLGETYEAAVAYCQDKRGGKPKYEDKLVYEKALHAYEKAKKDPAFRAKAKRKIENVRPFIPTRDDRFMHQGAKIKSSCYDWLK